MFVPTLSLVFLINTAYSQDFSSSEDIRTLSELPLGRLLEVKRSFEINDANLTNLDDVVESRIDFEEPVALKLKNPSRGGYEHEHYDHEEYHHEKGGKKEMKNFFQLAVTALAFLAFGGYLLCLIVQAIKSKHMDQMTQMANMQVMTALLRRQINRKRTNRPRRTKPRRTTNHGGKKRPKREVVPWPDANPENLYYALVTLSEAYTNHHTVDYRNYNKTAKYFN